MADNMNFCSNCHAKYEVPAAEPAVSTAPLAEPETSNGDATETPKVQLPFWAKMWQKRITRKDFWIWTLICWIFNAVVSFIPVVGQIISFIICYFLITIGIARLHDSGKSAWNILWCLLPIIGWIILIVYYCKPSNQGENAWGPEPQRMFGGN